MKTIAYPQTASFFTLIIFFCENKLFQRDWGGGVFVLYCGNSGGVGGGWVISSSQIWKIQGGGGILGEIPSVVGYGYFLEPHIIADTFLMFFEGNISNVHIARLIKVISTKTIFLYALSAKLVSLGAHV